jgi:hypothetical protein
VVAVRGQKPIARFFARKEVIIAYLTLLGTLAGTILTYVIQDRYLAIETSKQDHEFQIEKEKQAHELQRDFVSTALVRGKQPEDLSYQRDVLAFFSSVLEPSSAIQRFAAQQLKRVEDALAIQYASPTLSTSPPAYADAQSAKPPLTKHGGTLPTKPPTAPPLSSPPSSPSPMLATDCDSSEQQSGACLRCVIHFAFRDHRVAEIGRFRCPVMAGGTLEGRLVADADRVAGWKFDIHGHDGGDRDDVTIRSFRRGTASGTIWLSSCGGLLSDGHSCTGSGTLVIESTPD